MNKQSPIGIFDSGVGGLTVLKELVKCLDNEKFIYFGDTINVPYGDKTSDELTVIVKKILDWYASFDVKMVIMACNTSSAVCLDRLKDNYDFKIIGIIEPATKAISKFKYKKIGLIATNATVNSNAYLNMLNKYNSNIELIQKATPELVKIIESNQVNSDFAVETLSTYTTPLIDKNIEKLILGCTHYPYISHIIEKIVGDSDFTINPAQFLVNDVNEYLIQNDLCSLTNDSINEFYVSGNVENFKKVSKLFYPCNNVENMIL